MIADFEKDKFISLKKMSDDKDYYNNVFKKSEKIISVVYYVLSHIVKSETDNGRLSTLEDKVLRVHEQNLYTLTVHRHRSVAAVEELRQVLVALESTLRVMTAGGLFSNEVLFILTSEIDTVIRTINHHYLTPDTAVEELGSRSSVRNSVSVTTPSAPRPATRPRSALVKGVDISSDAAKVEASLPDRKTRIITVLKAAGEASIKDLSDIIRDCSEKTIQRELNSLIEDGRVIRIGERRWSRYSVLDSPITDS